MVAAVTQADDVDALQGHVQLGFLECVRGGLV